MKRRALLAGLAAGSVISTTDWLRWFRANGVPGTGKELGIASAVADEAPDPSFLIYWFQEGGWDGYSMFNPIDTPNHAEMVIPAGELNPNPGWSKQRYRPTGYGTSPLDPPRTQGNITYGYLAKEGLDLFGDLAVLSSHYGNSFHSGGRWDYHHGTYSHDLAAQREADERTVLQAFAEAYGASYLLPHVAWHRWLSDGELSLSSYPEGTGYYEKLGPPHAHTVYGRTSAELRKVLQQIQTLTGNARDDRIRKFVDNLHGNFLKEKNGPTVAAFDAAVKIHAAQVGKIGVSFTPSKMFNDPALREEFGVKGDDEATSAAEVNGNPARSKGTPRVNVQALITWELLSRGLSIAFHLESRDVRGYDTHYKRTSVFQTKGQQDQAERMKSELWDPLKALVKKMKETPYKATGKSYWDYSTIVLASEMGRYCYGDVDKILADADDKKYERIMDQDICEHSRVNSVAFLGGRVKGNRQWGRVGSSTLDAIPLLPSGALDPAYDPVTGELKPGANPDPSSFVPGPGHVYATALALAGLDPIKLKAEGKGRNESPPLSFLTSG
ncbi:MAG: DUF1501 domain-containing protein [Polyangiaceae bacterium]|jgi:hypothetical protein|nr:DUF1501 domain-containing protein [Polyangiaceae bacterium]